MKDSVEKEKNRGADLKADIKIDRARQALIVDGHETVLQHKPWQVLTTLVDAAPKTITRDALINDIWAGNFSTGEKGLNQSLWTIRSVLNDNARQPKLIRTIPRKGYNWIGPLPVEASVATSLPQQLPFFAQQRFLMIAATAAALMLATPLLLLSGGDGPDTSEPPTVTDASGILTASNGTRAFYDPREIVVEHFEGCKFYIQSSPTRRFSPPVFSENGAKIAFQVNRLDKCSLVVIDLENQTSEEFGACVTPDQSLKANPAASGEFI